jgi:peptidyl-tRNA hydrolase, PTH1 family
MYLLVGLGNPGDKYRNSKHNIGFTCLSYLATRHGLTFSQSKWKGMTAQGMMFNEKVILLKPMTYMNLSGESLGPLAAYYRIEQQKILVIHDDLDMANAKVKLCTNRGPGGHNGIKSIISHLSGKQFARLKIGIDRPDPAIPVSNYVLGKFTPQQMSEIEERYSLIEDAIQFFIKDGINSAMNKINSKG